MSTEPTIIKANQPCPDQQSCKSSDAYQLYSDGHGYCFSCKKDFQKVVAVEDTLTDTISKFYPHRGIPESTLKLYNVKTKFQDDKPTETGFIYPNGSVKIRNMEKKDFYSKGDMKTAGLFGLDKFDGNGKVIVITEGEYDAMSVYSALKIPAVSIRSSSSATKDCQENYEKLNSFDKIILAFDNDDPGQKAAVRVSSLFDFNKLYNVKFDKYKDANEYLQNNKLRELQEVIQNASKYSPDNIISSYKDIEDALQAHEESVLSSYPFLSLQNNLFGLHEGEVIVFKGEEGIGKTEVFRAIQNHILKESKDNKIGIFHLEEDKATTIKGIANYFEEYPYLHPEHTTDGKDILDAYKKASNNSEDRIFIYESFDVEDESTILDNIRFLVSAYGVKFIFLDHISWLATGMDNEDERKKLDRISQKIKLLAKELKFCFVMISHTNDEGKTRGSRNITKVANTVIHMDRDKTSPVEAIRLKTNFTVEKARLAGGQTGEAGYGYYDLENLMLNDGG